MEGLPSELIMLLALKFDLSSIASICRSNHQFNKVIGDNEFFWQSKFIHDFKRIPTGIKRWKLLYQRYQEIWCMGINNVGNLGFRFSQVKVPARLTGFKFKQISAGFSHVLAIDLQGNSWSYGDNSQGQLGLGDNINRNYPSQLGWGQRTKTEIPEFFFPVSFPASRTGGDIVEVAFKVKQVSAGKYHSAFIDLENNVWTCGHNLDGQLGHGEVRGLQYWDKEFEYEDSFDHNALVPIKIPNFQAKMISCGDDHTVAIDLEDRLWMWGSNFKGELGLGDTQYRDSPTLVSGLRVKQVVAGNNRTALIDLEDRLWMWGSNFKGELGLGDTQYRDSPTLVSGLRVKQVALGCNHTLLIDLEDNVWGWGWNKYGQLGLGPKKRNLIPVRLPISKANNVTAGYYHSIIIDLQDNIWVTGFNLHGELGLGDNNERTTFNLLPYVKATQSTAGYAYSVIIGTRIEE